MCEIALGLFSRSEGLPDLFKLIANRLITIFFF